jgi:hypothetical protein
VPGKGTDQQRPQQHLGEEVMGTSTIIPSLDLVLVFGKHHVEAMNWRTVRTVASLRARCGFYSRKTTGHAADRAVA